MLLVYIRIVLFAIKHKSMICSGGVTHLIVRRDITGISFHHRKDRPWIGLVGTNEFVLTDISKLV